MKNTVVRWGVLELQELLGYNKWRHYQGDKNLVLHLLVWHYKILTF